MTKYDGWTNFETWSVNLIITNNKGLNNYWSDKAKEEYDYQRDEGPDQVSAAINGLADILKSELEDSRPNWVALFFNSDKAPYALLWSQLMGTALCEVNYREIAKAFIEEIHEEAVSAEVARATK